MNYDSTLRINKWKGEGDFCIQLFVRSPILDFIKASLMGQVDV